ncbi:GlxA family transcriptional regulator [Neorhizobium galegae]|uniref:Transcriptional regulator GbdR n=1 Tax=Neorhizobium galegae bv. orientalis str. HAMBI 540 TaxID=1028800 RepID=A0A068T0F8_NEOGA|nr:GlxA family transcriptional regulator [Neorhizobium galegae]MCQ1854563.1 GlxA family transcriptional regulator [Neorhizobium galegae]CDN51917.1 Transcriptional regulator GbdR [Neorhizobium galegae bv. orientalis str. HAMBI 540]CDZ51590.1 Transcriptional regulator GbdR [Neorhizobium galegae bv. orientalis]
MRQEHFKKAEHKEDTKRLKVGFVLARSFTLSAFAMFIDTLRLASDQKDRSGRVLADWQVLGSTRHLIPSSCGIQVAPTSDFVDPTLFDYIVVVGGLLSVSQPVDQDTIAFLKQAASHRVPLIGVCTGSFILAEAGLMRGHEVCVSWLHYQAFRERFPELNARSDRLFHLDGRRGSCAGGSSAADLANVLVERHIGRDAARNALEILQIDRARSAKDCQARRPIGIEADDPRITSVLITMEQNLEGDLSLSGLAKSVGLSRRQLERLFEEKAGSSPGAAYRMIRLERAKELLQNTNRATIDVAFDVGFVSASHFTKAFKQVFGQTPSSLRASCAGASGRAG